jgi:hypothetical protein
MDFKSFLRSWERADFWTSTKIFCFKGTDFCPLFFSNLFGVLQDRQLLPYPKQKLLVEGGKNDFHAQLEQSILGNYSFYWLGNLSDFAQPAAGRSKNTKFLDYLFNYQGPHSISFFMSSDFKGPKLCDNSILIELDSEIGVDYLQQIFAIFSPKTAEKKLSLANRIFSGKSKINLDSACMLIKYFDLINIKAIDDFCGYLETIFGQQPALSSLSASFWAKNSKEFFRIWSEINKDYPEVFWVIFWSEQIWKAHHTICFLNQKNFIKAKQCSYGLPYSFINKDFKNFKLRDLRNLYEFLYDIDFAIKTGSKFYSLDLFYLNYFQR